MNRAINVHVKFKDNYTARVDDHPWDKKPWATYSKRLAQNYYGKGDIRLICFAISKNQHVIREEEGGGGRNHAW